MEALDSTCSGVGSCNSGSAGFVQVLNRVTEALGRQGGAQVSFRMAAARQDLAVDQCPTMESIMEYAEYVQAQAGDL